MRRVAWRLIPFLLLCYVVSFLDRVNVSFAALQMNRDLGFNADVYGTGAGLFFITYCLFEVPSNLILFRVGASRWIARIMFTWGLVAAGMAFISGPYSFYAMRLLLGVAEAGFFPGVLYFLSLWFPAAWRGRVIGLFMTGVALSGIIGNPLSGMLLGLDGMAGLRGWQWMFILEGLPAVILAPLVLIFLKDGPAHATWLHGAGKAWLVATLKSEQQATGGFKPKSTSVRALLNPRVLLLALTYFSNVLMINGIQFFLPTILKGFGLSNVQTGFVAAIPSVAALFAVLWWGRRSDARKERYGHAAFANLLAGVALLVFAVLGDPTQRIVAVTVALAATLAFTAPFWSIPPTFLAGVATAGGYGIISSLGVVGGFVAPKFIGWQTMITGDSRVGLGVIAVFAIVISGLFYVIGRRLAGESGGAALTPGVVGGHAR
jgi:MFS family permease